MSKNNFKRANQTKKEPYVPGLFDKPMVQEIEAGVPLSLAKVPDTGDPPAIYDKEYCGRTYSVEGGMCYQIRLGIHSSSLGIGAMGKESAVVCGIPVKPADAQRLMALLFIPEMRSIRFLDAVCLKAPQPIRLEYVWGSARIESNNSSGGVTLRDDAVELIDDEIIILQNGLEDLIPDYCTFSFDFLTFQVKVVCDNSLATEQGD